MSLKRAKALLRLGTLALLVAGIAAPVGTANPYKVKDLQPISGPSPFAAGCGGARDETRITGYEFEPTLAVNPADPRNIIAAWQQDRSLVAAARTHLVAASTDRGRTWTRVQVPGISKCTGGQQDAVADAWLTIGPDGAAYLASLPGIASQAGFAVEFLANRSIDGGLSWSAPVRVAAADPRTDKEAIAADPGAPGTVYATWGSRDPDRLPFSVNALLFARTRDGGVTWSPPQTIDVPPPGEVDQSSVPLVLPGGDVLVVFSRVSFAGEEPTATVLATRSGDGGASWSAPALVAGPITIHLIPDPETGFPLPAQGAGIPTQAVAPDGTVYVAWEEDDSASSGRIVFSRSRDGGLSWSAPRPLAEVGAFAFMATLAVTSRGTVGATWYDLRNDRPGDGELTTDVWFAHSHDRGQAWERSHLAGPFDLRTAPEFNLGEYQALAPLPGGAFAAVFAQAGPQAQDGPTDIFFARLGPGRGPNATRGGS